jgi:maleylacetoacetate isomerase
MSSDSNCILHSYWRSSSSWRVRLALQLKGIPYSYNAVNLLNEAHLDDNFAKLNAMKALPVLEIDGQTLSQSVSIMEYLEETRPNPPLMPKEAIQRAKVRQIVQIVASDIQPIQNLRVLKKISEGIIDPDEMLAKKKNWAQYWISIGFEGVH